VKVVIKGMESMSEQEQQDIGREFIMALYLNGKKVDGLSVEFSEEPKTCRYCGEELEYKPFLDMMTGSQKRWVREKGIYCNKSPRGYCVPEEES